MNRLIPLVLLFLSTAVLARSMPVQGAAASRPLGAVIQSRDYDPIKDQTTFHILNASGKQINAFDLSMQVKLPDLYLKITLKSNTDHETQHLARRGDLRSS